MANTYELIASSTVGSGGAAYIEFTSIPSTYTDLKLVCSLRDDRTDTTTTDAVISYNGAPGGANYNLLLLVATGGSSSASYSGSGANSLGGQYENSGQSTSNTFCNFEHTIFNYAGSTNKVGSTDGAAVNNGTNYFGFTGTIRTSTAAITSVRVTPYYGTLNYVQNSTAYLYGIKNS